MDKEELKGKLQDFWERVKEIAEKVWEEIVDRAYDLWDSFKRLDKRIQIAIIAGASFIILLAILIPLIYTPKLDIIAVQNTAGLLGEGNYITVKNNSNKDIKDINLIVDDKYIYYLEKISAGEQVKVLSREFHYRQENNTFGDVVGKDFVGERLKVVSPQGEAEVMLVEKKGWFR